MTTPILKVACGQCKKRKYVNANALKIRIAKYGSVAEIEKKWLCHNCKKEKEAKANKETIPEVQEKKK